MQAEVKGGDDAEIATPAPEAPEQVRVLAFGRHDLAAVGGDHLRRNQVVADIAELALQPAAAAAERQSGDSRRRVSAAGQRQPVCGGGRIELSPVEAGLGATGPDGWIDPHILHAAQVDAQAIVADCRAGDGVATAEHRYRQRLAPCQVKRQHHVIGVVAAGNDRRPAVDHAVVDASRLVVTGIVWVDESARKTGHVKAAYLGNRHRALPGLRPTNRHVANAIL